MLPPTLHEPVAAVLMMADLSFLLKALTKLMAAQPEPSTTTLGRSVSLSAEYPRIGTLSMSGLPFSTCTGQERLIARTNLEPGRFEAPPASQRPVQTGKYLHLRRPICDDCRKNWGSIPLLSFAFPPSSVGLLPLADKGPYVTHERPGQIRSSNRTRWIAKLRHLSGISASDRAGAMPSPTTRKWCAGKGERDQRMLWDKMTKIIRCQRPHGDSLWLGQDDHFGS